MAKMYQAQYWHAKSDGSRNCYGRCYEPVPESDVPDDVPITVLGMHEDAAGQSAKDQHWRAFYAAINADEYVRLSHKANPISPVVCTNKAEADKQFGSAEADAKSGKPRELTIVNGVNQLNSEYWDWNKRERMALTAGSIEGIARVIEKRLVAAGYPVKEFHIIKHDRDEKVIWDFDADAERRVPKALHVHWLIKLDKRVRSKRPLDLIADIIGIAPENLIYPERGKYSWENPMAYLIHAKDEDKTMYDPREVFTLRGTPYAETYSEKKRDWDIGRAAKSKKRTAHDIDWLLDRIRSGKVERAELHDESGEYWSLYSRHRRACDDAMDLMAEHRRELELEAFERGEFSMTTLFVHGQSGNGKTALIKGIIKFLAAVYGWVRGKGGAKNATETWEGQQILFLDDTSSIGMSADGWKQFLDPYNASPLSERFHNRGEAKPRLLIISSSKSPLEYFAYMSITTGENIAQYFRRLGNVLQVLDYDEWDGYNYSVLRPERVPEYTAKVELNKRYSIGDDSMVTCTLANVNYAIRTPKVLLIDGEAPMYAPWGAAEEIVRDIDRNNGGIIAARSDADAVFHQVWYAIAEEFRPTPLPFPADYEQLPPAIPMSKTKPKLLAAAKSAREAEARELEAKRAAEEAAAEEARLNAIVEDGEYAGMTLREAQAAEQLHQDAERHERSMRQQEQAAAKKREERAERARQEIETFIATQAEDFLHGHFDSILTNEFWLVRAVRGHLKWSSNIKELSNDELVRMFVSVYQSRFPGLPGTE